MRHRSERRLRRRDMAHRRRPGVPLSEGPRGRRRLLASRRADRGRRGRAGTPSGLSRLRKGPAATPGTSRLPSSSTGEPANAIVAARPAPRPPSHGAHRAMERAGAFRWPGPEGICPLVDLGAEPADPGPGHAARAHGLDRIIDRTCRNTMDVGVPDHGHEGRPGPPPWLRNAGRAAALPEPGGSPARSARRAYPGRGPVRRCAGPPASASARPWPPRVRASTSERRSTASASISRTRPPSAFAGKSVPRTDF